VKQLKKARKLLSICRVRAWRNALWRNGVAASTEHVVVLRCLGVIRAVVDVGANRGQFALAVRHCLPLATVTSFEPMAAAANDFRNVFHGDTKACVHQTAIGPTAGKATLHISKRDDSSSLLPILPEQDRIFPGTSEIGTEEVRVSLLAGCISESDLEAPSLLKLDVQGFELEALSGCDSLLHRFAWIYVECSFIELYGGQASADQVVAWLRDRGFCLHGLYNVSYDDDGRAVQGDFLFRQSRQHG
jgi:FkbM family methyltransferase